MSLLAGLGAAALLTWVFVGLALWLNPPLRTKPPGKKVTISGKPVEIVPLEEFKITVTNPCACRDWFLNPGICTCPPPPPTSLLMDIYTTVVLEGLLLRGICG